MVPAPSPNRPWPIKSGRGAAAGSKTLHGIAKSKLKGCVPLRSGWPAASRFRTGAPLIPLIGPVR
jgi:hypothetical protein